MSIKSNSCERKWQILIDILLSIHPTQNSLNWNFWFSWERKKGLGRDFSFYLKTLHFMFLYGLLLLFQNLNSRLPSFWIWKSKALAVKSKSHQLPWHSSEIRCMCLMKCSSETLQNLPYFWNMKTHTDFSFRAALFSLLLNALVNVDIRKKIKYVEQNEKMS